MTYRPNGFNKFCPLFESSPHKQSKTKLTPSGAILKEILLNIYQSI